MKRTLVDGQLGLTAIGGHVKTEIGIFNARPTLGVRSAFAGFKVEIVESAVGRFDMECFFFAGIFFSPLDIQRIDQAAQFVRL